MGPEIDFPGEFYPSFRGKGSVFFPVLFASVISFYDLTFSCLLFFLKKRKKKYTNIFDSSSLHSLLSIAFLSVFLQARSFYFFL